MNPEARIARLEAQVAQLTQFVGALRSTSLIPFDVEKAFRDRLRILYPIHKVVYDLAGEAVNNNRTVNEGGTSSYSVLAPPDAWIFITIPAEDQTPTKLGIPVYNQ